jgi:hypothetical protein
LSAIGVRGVAFLAQNQDEVRAIEELEGTSGKPPTADRAAAIIAAAILEDRLTKTLIESLHKNPKITDELFKVSGALGYFGTKINLGYLIGLYSEAARKDLDNIKEIRNDFAHKLTVTDFTSQKMRALSMNLKIVEGYVEGPDISGFTGTIFTLSGLGRRPIVIHKRNRDEALASPRERFIMSAQVLAALLGSLREAKEKKLTSTTGF